MVEPIVIIGVVAVGYIIVSTFIGEIDSNTGSDQAEETTETGDTANEAICKECAADFEWYSNLSWWKKAAYAGWYAWTWTWCKLKGC